MNLPLGSDSNLYLALFFSVVVCKFLKSSGFILINKKLNLVVPNLLSPIENRDWSYTFHIGGYLSDLIKKKYKNQIWFTKGDGDRDWPTPFDLKRGSI